MRSVALAALPLTRSSAGLEIAAPSGPRIPRIDLRVHLVQAGVVRDDRQADVEMGTRLGQQFPRDARMPPGAFQARQLDQGGGDQLAAKDESRCGVDEFSRDGQRSLKRFLGLGRSVQIAQHAAELAERQSEVLPELAGLGKLGRQWLLDLEDWRGVSPPLRAFSPGLSGSLRGHPDCSRDRACTSGKSGIPAGLAPSIGLPVSTRIRLPRFGRRRTEGCSGYDRPGPRPG